MKEINELVLPSALRYAEDHEWVKLEGKDAIIGISDYAQNQLGEVVFVELPEVGASLDKGELFGTVESVKAVSELLMPIGGEVTAVNPELKETPELVNNDPYEGGWMIRVRPSDPAEINALMDKTAYLVALKG
jgi:glycine cleavage system H protein